MPTVIDNLVLSLNLNTSGFNAAQRQALADLRKFQTEAERAGKKTEENSERQLAFMSKLRREAATLFATLAGGAGIKALVTNIVQGDAALARFGRTIGDVSGDATKLVKAFELAGSQDALGGIAGLAARIQQAGKGADPALLGMINTMMAESGLPAGSAPDITSDKTSASDKILSLIRFLTDAASRIEQKTPGRGASYLMQDIGIPADMTSIMVQGPKRIEELFEKALVPTKEQAAAAERLTQSFNELRQTIDSVLRVLTPELEKIVKNLQEKVQELSKSPEKDSALDFVGRATKWYFNIFNDENLGKNKFTFPDSDPGRDNVINAYQRGRKMPALPPPKPPEYKGWNFPVPKASDRFPSGGSEQTVNITGPITVTTQATDAQGVADGLATAIQTKLGQRQLATQANGGPQ